MQLAVLTALVLAAAPPVSSEGALSSHDARAVLREAPLSVDARTLHAAARALKRQDKARDIDVVLVDARFSYDEDGGRVLTSRFLYWLNTAAGVRDWGSVYASWQPGVDARPEVRARVIDGVLEHHLDPTTLTQAAAEGDDAGTYDDRQELRGPLPAARAGVLVEEVVVYRVVSAPFRSGRVDTYWFNPTHDARSFAVVIDHPRTLPVRFRLRGLVGERSKQVGEQRVTLRLEGTPPRRSLWGPMLPPWAPQGSYVAVSTGASWNGVARGYSDIVDGVLAKSERLSDIADAMAPAGVARDELVRRVLEQNHEDIRYASLAFGAGTIVPRTPEQTLERRYGDCKDKATLLVGVLRARGFRAHVALLRAWEPDDVLPRMPGIGLFNHAIVYLPADPERGLPERWIDPTDPSVPFGELPEGDQGRLALVAAAETVDLVRIPRWPAEQNRIEREVRVELAPAGHGRVVETTRATGTLAHDTRGPHVGEQPKAIEQALVQAVTTRFALLDDEALKKKTGTPEHPRALAKEVRVRAAKGLGDREPIEIAIDIPRAGVTFSSADEAQVWLSSSLLLGQVPRALTQAPKDGDASPRRLPFHLTQAKTVVVRHHVIPPQGYTMEAPPKPFSLEVGGVHLHRTFELDDDGSLRGESVLVLEPSQLTLAEVKRLREGFTRFADQEEVLATFRADPARFLEKGDARASLEAWRERIATSPKASAGYVGYLDALASLGFVEEARRVAKQGTERAPKSTELWARFGWTHLLGTHGGEFERGWDSKGAERGYRQALTLSPDMHHLRPTLARVIALDSDGNFTTDAARLSRALEALKPVTKESASEATFADARLLRAALLSQAGRHREVLALEGEPRSDVEKGARLVAEAIVNGAAAAEAALTRYAPDPAARATLAESAVTDLLRVGAFSQAAALLRANARHSQNPAAALQRASGIEQAASIALPAWDADVDSLGKRVFSAIVGPQADVDEVLARLHPYTSTKDREEFHKSYEQMRRQVGTGSEGLQRLVLANLAIVKHGDDDTGWLLFARGPGLGLDKTGVLVVRDPRDQRYRIAEVRAFRALPLALLALDHIAGGHVERARTVLKWHDDALGGGTPERLKWLERADVAGLQLFAGWMAALTADPAHLPRLRPLIERTVAAPVSDDGVPAELERRALNAFAGVLARSAQPADHRLMERALAAAEARATTDALRAEHLVARAVAYRHRGRWDEAIAAQRRMQELNPTPEGVRFASGLAFAAGRMAEAIEHSRAVLEKNPNDANAKNQLAWLALYDDRVPLDEAVRLAQEAAASTQYKAAAHLHTLACVLLESGREADALSLARQIERLEGSAYDGVNALIWARAAQRLGLPAEAKRTYARVEDKDGDTQLTLLVERWTKEQPKATKKKR